MGRRAPRRWWAVAAALAALAACTGGPTDGSTSAGYASSTSSAAAPLTLSWDPVPLPSGVEVRTLTTMGDRLLVGGLEAGSPPRPVLIDLDAGGRQAEVPLTPRSPYAAEARWYSVATDGTRIVAVGGANGGAHANVRWTTWAGSAAGVTELPQSFYTFGGWGAGELVDAVITADGEALVGSWGGAKAGLDAAVWTFADPVWTRQDPAGTALESTATLLVGPRGATADGRGILVTGSALHLDAGVAQTAAVWRSTGVNAGWRRVDLPDAGQHSESVSASCEDGQAGVCVVTGQVDGALALWSLDGDRAGRTAGLPSVMVDDQAVVPRPMRAGRSTLVVSPDGDSTVVLQSTSSGWAKLSGPTGIPAAAALVGDRLYVATRTAAGAPASLSVARTPG